MNRASEHATIKRALLTFGTAAALTMLASSLVVAQPQVRCVPERQRLTALMDELRRLEGLPPTSRPGTPARPLTRVSPGEQPPPSPERDEAAIAEWHRLHDAEMKKLEARLASSDCQTLNPPSYGTHAPYDLVSDSRDDNGFQFNPRWGKQEEYFLQTGSQDLWVAKARPDILLDCFNHAEPQSIVGVDNDYDAFRNGYCKHSPGAINLNPFFCKGDQEITTQPGGPIYCASYAWKDSPTAAKCAWPPLGSGNMNDISQDGGFAVTYHNAGHENFAVATYDGILNWDNAQAEWEGDSDWCINLYTQHGVGVTGRKDGVQVAEEESFIHTEFDPHNLGDDWDRGFWGELRNAIHGGQQSFGSGSCLDIRYCQGTTDNQNRTVSPMINGHRAIVIGLLGLDLGHNDAQSELHPVYGMAIHIGGRPLAESGCNWQVPVPGHCNIDPNAYKHPEKDPIFDVPQNPNDDSWAMFATNFGNEGYCSTRALHMLDGDESVIGRKDFPTLTFRLPWANDESGKPMAGVDILDTTNFALHAQVDLGRRDATVDTNVDPGRAILVTFHLWPSGARSNFFGELHLKWRRAPGDAVAQVPALALTPTRIATLVSRRSEEESHPTAVHMTDTQARAFAAEWMKNTTVTPPGYRVSIIAKQQSAPPPSPPPAAVSMRAPAGETLTPGAVEEEAAAKRALCASYGGHVPDLPADFCQPILGPAAVSPPAGLRGVVTNEPTEVVVPANVLWVGSGIHLTKGQAFTVEATGLWSNIGPPSLGPDGINCYLYPGTVLATASLGSLIGKVGDTIFAIGSSWEGVSPAEGILYLAMNDTPSSFTDNEGEVHVRITLH